MHIKDKTNPKVTLSLKNLSNKLEGPTYSLPLP